MKLVLLFVLMLSSQLSFGQHPTDGTQAYFSPEVQSEKNVRIAEELLKETRRNTVYFELAGSGGFGSFNFEWNFKSKDEFRWMLRTGISGTYIDKNNRAALIFPVMVHGIYGKTHCVDIGIGQSLSLSLNGVFVRAPLSFGYRLEPKGKRIFYRISYTPIISYLVDLQWENWAGVSVGFKLKNRYK